MSCHTAIQFPDHLDLSFLGSRLLLQEFFVAVSDIFERSRTLCKRTWTGKLLLIDLLPFRSGLLRYRRRADTLIECAQSLYNWLDGRYQYIQVTDLGICMAVGVSAEDTDDLITGTGNYIISLRAY